jgi:hypothetical protein
MTQKIFDSQDGNPSASAAPLLGPVIESAFFVKPLMTAR